MNGIKNTTAYTLLSILDCHSTYFRNYLVRDPADERGRDFDAVEVLHMILDVAIAHAFCIHRDDLAIYAAYIILMLLYDFRLKLTYSITRNVNTDRPII